MDVQRFCRDWVAGLSVATMLAVLPGVASSAESLRLEEYAGKVVLLDFWASWCLPCRNSFPWMNAMQQKYGDDGFIIVAVNLDNNSVDAAEFLREYPAKFRIVYDTEKELAREFDIQAMPSSFLIGRDGELSSSHLGFKEKHEAEYEAAIVEAITEKNDEA